MKNLIRVISIFILLLIVFCSCDSFTEKESHHSEVKESEKLITEEKLIHDFEIDPYNDSLISTIKLPQYIRQGVKIEVKNGSFNFIFNYHDLIEVLRHNLQNNYKKEIYSSIEYQIDSLVKKSNNNFISIYSLPGEFKYLLDILIMNQRVKIITNNTALKEVSWKIDLYGTMADKVYSTKGIEFLTIWIAYGLIDNLEFNLDEVLLEDSIEFN